MDKAILILVMSFIVYIFISTAICFSYYIVSSFFADWLVKDVEDKYEVKFDGGIYSNRYFAKYVAKCFFYEKKVSLFR